MADNITAPATGEVFATDDIGGVQFPLTKIAIGADGTNGGPVSVANPLPIAVVPPTFWRVGFAEVGAGLQGKAAEELTLLKTGAGMAVSQSGGNLIVTTGTTANSETVLRSALSFRGSLAARYKAILSQRIANQLFRFELADLVGDGLAYTINSATSVTVTFPVTNPFTSANVGQSLRLAALSSVGIPGRYPIASVSGLTVTFTVAGWPASGSGTLTLYGFNWLANEYSGTTATNSTFDAQRRGWASGNTTLTINTTASPGHVVHLNFDVMSAGISDGLVASNGGYQWTTRGSRVENVPDEDVDLYFFVVVQNGSAAPASSTTMTVGFLQVEDQGRQKVRIASSDPGATHALPVQLMGGTTAVTGTITANIGTGSLAAGANLIGDVGQQYRANATGAGTPVNLNCPATPAVQTIKGSAGRLIGIYLVNTNAAMRWLKVFNATAPALASAAAALRIPLPQNQPVFISFEGGMAFATAITCAISSTGSLTDATGVGTLDDVTGLAVFS